MATRELVFLRNASRCQRPADWQPPTAVPMEPRVVYLRKSLRRMINSGILYAKWIAFPGQGNHRQCQTLGFAEECADRKALLDLFLKLGIVLAINVETNRRPAKR